MPNLRHLTVRCPGQDPRDRGRRSIVDYALISLRIAVERAPLGKLHKLSLSSVHPAAFCYLRHTQGFGSVPSAGRRWSQIRKLSISVESSSDLYAASSASSAPPPPGLDLLKIMDDYVRFFAPGLDKFSFAWVGPRGPCPVSLSTVDDALSLAGPPGSLSRKLFHEVTSPMSPLPTRPPRPPIRFPRLRHLRIRNAAISAPQLGDLIRSHSRTVKGFDFDNVVLAGAGAGKGRGSWDEALAPLSRDPCWAARSSGAVAASASASASASSPSLVAGESDEELSCPSAAVEAASRELLQLDLGWLAVGREEGHGVEGLADDGADDTVGFTAKLRRTRTRRRRREDHDGGGGSGSSSARGHDTPESRLPRLPRSPPSPSPPPPPPPPAPSPSSSSSSSSPSSSRHHHQSQTRKPSKRKLKPAPASGPDARPRPVAPTHSPPTPKPIIITAPILASDPHPVLLQPTVYDPSRRRRRRSSSSSGITSVQRNLEQEEAHRRLAQDPDARVSALRKAKQAVLCKLSREFCAKRTREADTVAAACRLVACREWTAGGGDGLAARDTLLEDGMRCESQSAVVPLMLCRS
ncbi:hypothetical protein E4U41_005777 [Claviceps citrina]|nr:hypothetical protein E4U41_005777 [Claviceps citrina]